MPVGVRTNDLEDLLDRPHRDACEHGANPLDLLVR
jgi:hypothetical protein